MTIPTNNISTDDIPSDSRHDGQSAFDAALRQVHADAVARVSARTRAQLQLRRRAALSARTPQASPSSAATRRFGWPVAASFAALLAIAFAVQMRQDVLPASPSSTFAASEEDEVAADIAALDENPDFYLWLASNDAVALASE